MGLTDKLCNPTPFEVVIKWEPGIPIIVPPDGHARLNYQQLEDFRPGKPGSEEIRNMIEPDSIFLFDDDKTYDSQALASIERAIKLLSAEYTTRITHLRNSRSAQGMKLDDETLEALVQQIGLDRIRDKIEVLKGRKTLLDKAVSGKDAKIGRQAFDVKRTCFGLNPPREFESETHLAIFLNENPELGLAHKKFVDGLKNAKE